MSKPQAWKPSYYIKEKEASVTSAEYQVPILLGIALRVSQFMGLAPLRLRRSLSNWLIEVSPHLVVFQRLILTVTSIAMYIGLGFDFVAKVHVRAGTAIFTSVLWTTEMSLVMSVYLLRTLNAPGAMDRLIVQLKQINKINNELNHGISSVGCHKYGKNILISYIIISFLINIYNVISYQFNTNSFIASIYICFHYQSLSVNLIQLQESVLITAITSLVTSLNDKLERLLQSITQNSDGAIHPKYQYLTIRQLAQSYEQICDVILKVNKDSGIHLLLVFTLMFLRLLITPYNFISAIVKNKNTGFIVHQACWSIYHFCTLLVMVEPCHWMQDQMDRTRYLVSRLARRMGESDERISRELDLFMMQIQLKGIGLTPMGVFTVSRALVASIIGSVSTYLVILIQMHDGSEIL